MSKQHFARLDLERLEEVALPNMLWGPVSPSLFFDQAAPEPPGSISLQNPSQIRDYAQVSDSILTHSGQAAPGLFPQGSQGLVHFDSQTGINSPRSKDNNFSFASDDLTDPLKLDFFGVDLPKGPARSFAGGDSLTMSAAVRSASNAPADGTGPSIPPDNAGLSSGFIAGSPGATSLLINPGLPPTLFLPPANSAPAVLHGSQKGAPVPRLISPSFGSSPNVPGQNGLQISVPTYVPVNADNDNGSPIAKDVHGNRDFSVTFLPVNDPELIQGSANEVGLPAGGTWTIEISYFCQGRINLWKDQRKTAGFMPPGTFYVEGEHESSKSADVAITFWYTFGTNSWGLSSTLTVTPLINSFTVTPGNNPGPNIVFINGIDATNGMLANTPGGNPGASFSAKLTVTSLTGNPVLIQNVTGIQNGSNGTSFNGKPVGATFIAGTNPAAENVQLTMGSFSILDTTAANAAANNPEYPLGDSSNDGNTATLDANDSPGIAPTDNAAKGTAIDVVYNFTLYLVWKYPSGIYYPLAYVKWAVTFWAKGPGPVNNIQNKNGVTANKWVPDNKTPDAMAPPIISGNVKWAAA